MSAQTLGPGLRERLRRNWVALACTMLAGYLVYSINVHSTFTDSLPADVRWTHPRVMALTSAFIFGSLAASWALSMVPWVKRWRYGGILWAFAGYSVLSIPLILYQHLWPSDNFFFGARGELRFFPLFLFSYPLALPFCAYVAVRTKSTVWPICVALLLFSFANGAGRLVANTTGDPTSEIHRDFVLAAMMLFSIPAVASVALAAKFGSAPRRGPRARPPEGVEK